MMAEPATGTSSLRHGEPPAGYSLAPNRSVKRMNATTTMPTSAPINSVRSRKTWSSRSRKNAFHCCDDASLPVIPAASPAFVILAVPVLWNSGGSARCLRRRRRFRLVFRFAAGQEKAQTQHLFPAALFFEVPCAGFQQISQRNEPKEFSGRRLHHRHSRNPLLRHTVYHGAQRLIRECFHGLVAHQFAECPLQSGFALLLDALNDIPARQHADKQALRVYHREQPLALVAAGMQGVLKFS